MQNSCLLKLQDIVAEGLAVATYLVTLQYDVEYFINILIAKSYTRD